MKRYTKTIDGKSVIKERKNIVLRRNGKQIINPREEMLIEEGWKEYIPEVYEPTEEELQEREKEHEARHAKDMLREDDYKIIKCMEYYLCGKELPYDINELHIEREEYRKKVNKL